MHRWHFEIHTVPLFVLFVLSLVLTACASQATLPPTATIAVEPVSTATQSQPTLAATIAQPTSPSSSLKERTLATLFARATMRPTAVPVQPTVQPPSRGNCDPSYPDVCIAPPPPDLDCKDIPYRRFRVLPPDPHRFDGDHDGIGCES